MQYNTKRGVAYLHPIPPTHTHTHIYTHTTRFIHLMHVLYSTGVLFSDAVAILTIKECLCVALLTD